MKVIKAFGPQQLRMVDAPVPEPGQGQVLLAVRASGICGSDKHYWWAGTPEIVAGHEAAGEVVALGPGVRRLQVGDRVAVNNVVGCGTCAACRAGQFVRCPHRTGHDVSCGFGEMLVAPERNCMKLDEAVDLEAGCLIFDNWGTPYGAVERACVAEGDNVVVSGCGPIGLGAIALASLRGAYVIAVDPAPYRQEAAIRMGADAVLSPGDTLPAAVRELTDGAGADTLIECSGSGAAYKPGLAALRIGGTFVVVGEGAQYDLRPSELIIRNHLNILGSWYSTMQQGAAVQDLIVRRKIDPKAFVTHRVSLPEMPDAFRRVIECTDNVLKTVILMPG